MCSASFFALHTLCSLHDWNNTAQKVIHYSFFIRSLSPMIPLYLAYIHCSYPPNPLNSVQTSITNQMPSRFIFGSRVHFSNLPKQFTAKGFLNTHLLGFLICLMLTYRTFMFFKCSSLNHSIKLC